MEIHPSADVQSKNIGAGTRIWQFAVILPGARIGSNCNINCHTFIENDVVIGDNVSIKSGTYVWDAIRIEDDVFIGPNVVFTNDLRPRSRQRAEYPVTTIKKGASLGANSTILAGITVGSYSMTGIASVVTRDVPDHALVYGTPARIQGWVDEKGRKLNQIDSETWENEEKERYMKTTNGLKKV
jgi:UDP-2-acetamido-3-amino-2,3-dideoxy-glucuronate N-acetyltransferase